jgi:hypothetical protein
MSGSTGNTVELTTLKRKGIQAHINARIQKVPMLCDYYPFPGLHGNLKSGDTRNRSFRGPGNRLAHTIKSRSQ